MRSSLKFYQTPDPDCRPIRLGEGLCSLIAHVYVRFCIANLFLCIDGETETECSVVYRSLRVFCNYSQTHD